MIRVHFELCTYKLKVEVAVALHLEVIRKLGTFSYVIFLNFTTQHKTWKTAVGVQERHCFMLDTCVVFA